MILSGGYPSFSSSKKSTPNTTGNSPTKYLRRMTLEIARWLFDFGTLILIWLVQLVIYPSFRFYTPEHLLLWHQQYTTRVSYVVLPLMLGQLLLVLLQLWQSISWYTGSSFILILLLWASTFLWFVPLHGQISAGNFQEKDLLALVRRNWWRTLGWSILMLLSLLEGNGFF